MKHPAERKAVAIFTDGACSGNPGPGGWSAVLKFGRHRKELSGAERDSTNQRMELTAAIEGLKALKQPCQVTVTSDSSYLIQGMKQWLPGWILNGWRNSKKEAVANRDLWEALIEAARPHQVEWVWTRGHAGNPENERADQLATAQAQAPNARELQRA